MLRAKIVVIGELRDPCIFWRFWLSYMFDYINICGIYKGDKAIE